MDANTIREVAKEYIFILGELESMRDFKDERALCAATATVMIEYHKRPKSETAVPSSGGEFKTASKLMAWDKSVCPTCGKKPKEGIGAKGPWKACCGYWLNPDGSMSKQPERK